MAFMYSCQWTWVLVMTCAALIHIAHAADPDPLQDFSVADLKSKVSVNGFSCKPLSEVTAKDFTNTGLRNPAYPTSVSETGATADLATIFQFPGLNTQGVSHARLDFAVGGVVPLHTQPRASETLYVVKGRVYRGFVSEENVLYASTLEVGYLTVFPLNALLHFQLNVGNETAITFNTLTSQNPGFMFSSNNVLVPNITSAVIEKSFGIDCSTVKALKSAVPRYWG